MRTAYPLPILVFILLSIVCRFATAAPLDHNQLLDEATGFFQEASQLEDQTRSAELYQKALIRFERLAQDGVVNGKLFYNLGNTYFQLHDLGHAVLNYRRAQLYIPNDENLRQNLLSARSQQPDRIEQQQEVMLAKTLFFWHYDLSVRSRLLLLVVTNALLWGGLALRCHQGRGLWWPLAVLLTLVVMLAGSLLYERFGREPQGVLVAAETMARKGDGQAYAPSFSAPLHAGLEFSLVEKRGEWLYIELADGRRCWVPVASAEII